MAGKVAGDKTTITSSTNIPLLLKQNFSQSGNSTSGNRSFDDIFKILTGGTINEKAYKATLNKSFLSIFCLEFELILEFEQSLEILCSIQFGKVIPCLWKILIIETNNIYIKHIEITKAKKIFNIIKISCFFFFTMIEW